MKGLRFQNQLCECRKNQQAIESVSKSINIVLNAYLRTLRRGDAYLSAMAALNQPSQCQNLPLRIAGIISKCLQQVH